MEYNAIDSLHKLSMNVEWINGGNGYRKCSSLHLIFLTILPHLNRITVEHIQRLMTQLLAAGYLDRAFLDSTSKSTDTFKRYLIEQCNAFDQHRIVKTWEESPLSQDQYEQALRIAKEVGSISVSMIQRRLHTGYAIAGRILEKLEAQGIIEPADGAKPRKVISME